MKRKNVMQNFKPEETRKGLKAWNNKLEHSLSRAAYTLQAERRQYQQLHEKYLEAAWHIRVPNDLLRFDVSKPTISYEQMMKTVTLDVRPVRSHMQLPLRNFSVQDVEIATEILEKAAWECFQKHVREDLHKACLEAARMMATVKGVPQ